jgi:hypothetical protein
MTTDEMIEVAGALERVAAKVRSFMPQFVDLQPDGSGSPRMLAMRDAFLAFPAPAEVLFIDSTGMAERRDGGPHWTLIRFDLSQPRTSQVNFATALKWAELPDHREMLRERFGVDENTWESLRNFRLVAIWDGYSYVRLAPFDIRTDPDEYGVRLGRDIGYDHNFVEAFLHEVDFNAKYSLQPDTVLSAPELLRLDFPSDAPATDNRLRQLPLSERQQMVRDIQLIPQVPDGVREIIRRAKKLYIYGYFEYSFFTISSHYTYAAMEAALRARWSLILPHPTKLKFKDKEEDVDRRGFGDIESYCAMHDWKIRKVFVNGKAFPWNSDMLLAWLRDVEVINDWQKQRFEMVYRPLRNSYSHMDGCMVHGGESGALRRAVETINILFDSVPLGGDTAVSE